MKISDLSIIFTSKLGKTQTNSRKSWRCVENDFADAHEGLLIQSLAVGQHNEASSLTLGFGQEKAGILLQGAMRLGIFSRVLLPAPLRPIIPTTSPGWTSNDTSRRAQNSELPAAELAVFSLEFSANSGLSGLFF